MLTKTLAVVLEGVGCVVILSGILIEVITGGHIGYILITTGALGVAFGGMVFAKLFKGK